MNAKRNTISWGYFLVWLILACIGVVVSFFVFFGVMSALGGEGRSIPYFAASLIMTACFGTTIGLAQWSILRRYVQRYAVWIGVTLLGFLVASPILLSLGGGFGPVVLSINSFHMSIAMGAILGVLQWLVISRKVKWSTVWIGVSLISWFLAGWIGIGLKALSQQMGPIFFWIGYFFAGIFLSALGMIWLFNIRAEPGILETNLPDQSFWRRFLKLPCTRLGWWSVVLTVAYVILLIVPRAISGMVSLGQTGTLFIIMMIELCRWSGGIAGLTAVVEKHERSVVVWIAMLPAAYALINMLYNILRVLLVSQ